jgi:hypothetical protein
MNLQASIARAYAAFNRRDIDDALALMTGNVSWPKASEGGRVAGKEEVRAYWTRQWEEFDAVVEPVEIVERPGGVVEVTVHRRVKNLEGDVLFDGEVRHIYTFADGLIERMDLGDEEANPDLPAKAFSGSH